MDDRLPLRLLSLSGCTIDGRWGLGDMTAPTWRLYLDLDDGAEVWAGGRCTPLAAGHLYLIPAWLSWRARCRGPVRHHNAMLDLPSLPRERVMRHCRAVALLARPGEVLADTWLETAVAQARTGRAGPELQARGHALVWSALARYFGMLGADADRLFASGGDERLDRLRDWVGERLEQTLPRGALARAAGISEAELSRRCHAAVGTSPARWVRDLRVARAAELLRGTALPLDEIARRCGFPDRSRLSKVFARVVGGGPAAFRRRMRG